MVPDPGGDKRVITQEGNDSTRQEFQAKSEAVEVASRRAGHHRPSQVKVHKSDGSLEYENTYGDDPVSSTVGDGAAADPIKAPLQTGEVAAGTTGTRTTPSPK